MNYTADTALKLIDDLLEGEPVSLGCVLNVPGQVSGKSYALARGWIEDGLDGLSVTKLGKSVV